MFLNDGAGVFSNSGQALGSSNSYEVALGDVDGDGDLDLVTGAANERNFLYLNNGTADPWNGTGAPSNFVVGLPISLDMHKTTSIALGDVDGDGELDLVTGAANERLRSSIRRLNESQLPLQSCQ